MTAQIIDLTTARTLRDLEALHGRNRALLGLTRRQMQACRDAGDGLGRLTEDLRGFVRSLDKHRRRCEDASRRLRRAADAMESEDIGEMEAARDDLLAYIDRREQEKKRRRARHH